MKKLKIIIPVLVIVIIAAIAAVVFFFGDKIAITDKSRVSMGLSKTFDSIDDVTEVTKKDVSQKILKNLKGNAWEGNVKLSVEGEVEGLDEVVGEDNSEIVDELLDILSKASFNVGCALDPEQKATVVSYGAEIEDLLDPISLEIACTEDAIALRSKELKEEYIKIDREELIENVPEVEELLDLLDSFYDKDYSSMFLTEDELEHFTKTYKTVLSDFITDEMMTKEKVDFNGKSCTKETLKLTAEDIANLLKKYAETFVNDEEGKNIINEKLTNILGEDTAKEFIDELYEEMEDVDFSEEFEGEDIEIDFVTYCSLTTVYGTEWIFNVEGETAKLTEKYDGDTTTIIFAVEEEEFANFEVKTSGDKSEINGTITVEEGSIKVTGTVSEEVFDLAVTALEEEEELGTITFNVTTDVKENSAEELSEDVSMAIGVEFEGVSAKATLKTASDMKVVDKIEIPDLEDAVNALDEDELNDYMEDLSEAGEKYLKDLSENELFKSITDLIGSTPKSNSNYDFDTNFDFDDFDLDTGIIDEDQLDEAKDNLDKAIEDSNFSDEQKDQLNQAKDLLNEVNY